MWSLKRYQRFYTWSKILNHLSLSHLFTSFLIFNGLFCWYLCAPRCWNVNTLRGSIIFTLHHYKTCSMNNHVHFKLENAWANLKNQRKNFSWNLNNSWNTFSKKIMENLRRIYGFRIAISQRLAFLQRAYGFDVTHLHGWTVQWTRRLNQRTNRTVAGRNAFINMHCVGSRV